MNISRSHLQGRLLAISGALYLFSLLLPALLFEHHEPLVGGNVLAWGWWGVLLYEFAWFANPAYFVGVLAYLSKNMPLSKLASVVAIFLGLTSFHAKEWWFNEGSGTLILGLGAGYYIWMMSFSVMFAGCFVTSAPNPPPNMDAPPNGGAPVS